MRIARLVFSKIQHTPTFDRGPVSSSFWFSFGSARPARLSLSLRRHRSLAPIPVPPPVSPAIRKIHHLCHTVMHLWVPTSFLFFFAVEVTAIAFKFQIANDASIRFEVLRVWIDIRFSLLSPALSQQPSGSRLILCWSLLQYVLYEGNSLLGMTLGSQSARHNICMPRPRWSHRLLLFKVKNDERLLHWPSLAPFSPPRHVRTGPLQNHRSRGDR